MESIYYLIARLCLNLLTKFFFFFFLFFFFFSQTGRAHLILVTLTPGKPGGAIGVITLEGKLLTAAPCFFFFSFLNLNLNETN